MGGGGGGVGREAQIDENQLYLLACSVPSSHTDQSANFVVLWDLTVVLMKLLDKDNRTVTGENSDLQLVPENRTGVRSSQNSDI